MKKIIVSIFALSLIAGSASCQEKIDIEKEKIAIKAVIEGEIKASFEGDFESRTNFFVHEPYLLWLQAHQKNFTYAKGWQEINSMAKEFITPDRVGSMIHDGNYDYTIRVYKEAALATFKAKITVVQEDGSYELEGLEVRSLEKQDGEWKITYLGTVYSSTYEEEGEDDNGDDDDDEDETKE